MKNTILNLKSLIKYKANKKIKMLTQIHSQKYFFQWHHGRWPSPPYPNTHFPSAGRHSHHERYAAVPDHPESHTDSAKHTNTHK